MEKIFLILWKLSKPLIVIGFLATVVLFIVKKKFVKKTKDSFLSSLKHHKKRRPHEQLADFEQHWEELREKLSRLEKQRLLETRVEEKFRIEKLIEEINAERDRVEKEIDDLETQLSSDTKKVIGAERIQEKPTITEKESLSKFLSENFGVLMNFFLALSVIVMISGIMGHIVYSYKEVHSKNTVIGLQRQILALGGLYESRDDYGDSATREVREKAPQLAKQLLNVTDEYVEPDIKITKYHNVAYAFAMAASAETDNSERAVHADQSILAAEQCLVLIQQATDNAAGGGEYEQKLYEWIHSAHRKERTLYFLAVAFAIKARTGDDVAFPRTRKLLDAIPSAYKERYPPEKHPDLQWFLEHEEQQE